VKTLCFALLGQLNPPDLFKGPPLPLMTVLRVGNRVLHDAGWGKGKSIRFYLTS
jgi:hypothetical protein